MSKPPMIFAVTIKRGTLSGAISEDGDLFITASREQDRCVFTIQVYGGTPVRVSVHDKRGLSAIQEILRLAESAAITDDLDRLLNQSSTPGMQEVGGTDD